MAYQLQNSSDVLQPPLELAMHLPKAWAQFSKRPDKGQGKFALANGRRSPRLPVELLEEILDVACQFKDLRHIAAYSLIEVSVLCALKPVRRQRMEQRALRYNLCLVCKMASPCSRGPFGVALTGHQFHHYGMRKLYEDPLFEKEEEVNMFWATMTHADASALGIPWSDLLDVFRVSPDVFDSGSAFKSTLNVSYPLVMRARGRFLRDIHVQPFYSSCPPSDVPFSSFALSSVPSMFRKEGLQGFTEAVRLSPSPLRVDSIERCLYHSRSTYQHLLRLYLQCWAHPNQEPRPLFPPAAMTPFHMPLLTEFAASGPPADILTLIRECHELQILRLTHACSDVDELNEVFGRYPKLRRLVFSYIKNSPFHDERQFTALRITPAKALKSLHLGNMQLSFGMLAEVPSLNLQDLVLVDCSETSDIERADREGLFAKVHLVACWNASPAWQSMSRNSFFSNKRLSATTLAQMEALQWV